MNRILKNVYVILTTLILIFGAAFVATTESKPLPQFQIQNESGQQNISIYDAQDGNYYVFLPSYANLNQVHVILPSGQSFLLDDTLLTDQMSCEALELEKPYSLSADGKELATLWFYQSRNVAAMYIDTVSGEMTGIHRDKNYEESASMTLYAPDGSLDYADAGSELKGRGNSTWERDKRPYVLTLSTDGDLLGMGSAKKWILLANAYDETNLNNKLVFDLASQVPINWAPDSQFVDLYLNGEYRGLYLLAEKVEVHKNRMDIHAGSGDFLCQIDLGSRVGKMQNPFETSMGKVAEVCYPDSLSDAEFDNIQYLVYQMELEFRSDSDLGDSEILDLDSWVRRYLIDEISGNIDADLTSSYFYFSDGKFYAGPIWDYDKAFGNHFRNQEPHAFIAKNQNGASAEASPYYGVLYNNGSFYERMVEIYRTEFVPVLEKMVQHGIDDQIDLIRAASKMNSIRWRNMYDEWIGVALEQKVVRSADALKSYLIRRIQFLNSAWLENKDYCTVRFASETGRSFWNISVERGSCLETSYMDLENTVWLDNQTGIPVDLQSPITQDLVVKRGEG